RRALFVGANCVCYAGVLRLVRNYIERTTCNAVLRRRGAEIDERSDQELSEFFHSEESERARSLHQGAHDQAGQKRPLCLRLRQEVQELLLAVYGIGEFGVVFVPRSILPEPMEAVGAKLVITHSVLSGVERPDRPARALWLEESL